MNEFVNRKSQYTNRRKLDVKEITRKETGEIKTMIVDVSRADENVEERGTSLDAQTLNDIFSRLEQRLDEKIAEIGRVYYKADELNFSFVHDSSRKYSKTINIQTLQKLNVIIQTDDKDYIEITKPTVTNTNISFTISETNKLQYLNATGTLTYGYTIELRTIFSNARIAFLNCYVNVSFPSTGVTD